MLSNPTLATIPRNYAAYLRPEFKLRHAWVPMLGNTGPILYDVRNGKHGTLTNMDPYTDWNMTDKGYVMDFDGSNDGVCTGDGTHLGLTKELTYVIVLWKYASGGSAYGRIFDKYPAPSLYVYNFTSVYLYATVGGTSRDVSISGTLPKDQWVVLTVVLSPSSQKCYFNGVLSGSGTTHAGDYSEGTGVKGAIGNRCSDYARGSYQRVRAFYLFQKALSQPEITEITNDILLPLRTKRVFVPMRVPSSAVFKPYWYRNKNILIGA